MPTPTTNTPMYYPWHHFVLLPLALLMAGYAVLRYTKVAGDDDQTARLWFTVAALAVIGLGVLVMLRQHYALQLQDRICRLEVRQRYFEVSGQRFAALEKQLREQRKQEKAQKDQLKQQRNAAKEAKKQEKMARDQAKAEKKRAKEMK